MAMPDGMFGLTVRLGRYNARQSVWIEHPTASYTCRCGYEAHERTSPRRVELFVEEVPAAHRDVCPLGRPL